MTPGMAAWLIPAWFATLILAGAVGAWTAWPMAFDRGFEEADGRERHRHRIGDPQVTTLLGLPRAGRLALEPPAPEPLEPLPRPQRAPEPEWTFFGAQAEPQPGRAEYELMTRRPATAEVAVSRETPAHETPSAWTRRQVREMDAYIKEMEEKSNYFQHALKAPR